MGKKLALKGGIIVYSQIVYKEADMYIAWSPEFDVACQGKSLEDAVADLETSIRLYMTHPHARIPRIDFVAVASKVMQISKNEKTDDNENLEDCLV